jgi:hypothetical protein
VNDGPRDVALRRAGELEGQLAELRAGAPDAAQLSARLATLQGALAALRAAARGSDERLAGAAAEIDSLAASLGAAPPRASARAGRPGRGPARTWLRAAVATLLLGGLALAAWLAAHLAL